MIIYVTIDTENKTLAVTEDTSDYCADWYKVEFDSMSIQEIIQDVKENA